MANIRIKVVKLPVRPMERNAASVGRRITSKLFVEVNPAQRQVKAGIQEENE